jgi:hypothetical protein
MTMGRLSPTCHEGFPALATATSPCISIFTLPALLYLNHQPCNSTLVWMMHQLAKILGIFHATLSDGCVGPVCVVHQVMFMTGWSPARNQPKAAARGSATISFAEFAKQIDADKEGGTPTSPS